MKYLIAMSAVVLLASTSQAFMKDKMKCLHSGMSKNEVTNCLGEPDGLAMIDGYETFQYSNRMMDGWSWDRGEYNVVFKEGLVTGYGLAQVRQKQNPVQAVTVIPFPGYR